MANLASTRSIDHHPTSQFRKQVIDWSSGSLDVAHVRRRDGVDAVYLVRGSATRAMCRTLRERSDRQRVMRGVGLIDEKYGLDTLLQDEEYARERDALRRQGMPSFSRRTKLLLGLLGAVPVTVGVTLALICWVSGWSIFGNRIVDTVFVLLSGISGVVMVEVMFIDWVKRITEDDEEAARTWLIRHAGQLRSGALLVPVPKSPAEELEERGSVIEVDPVVLRGLLRTFRRAPLGVEVDPGRFTSCLWDTVEAWAKHSAVAAERVRVLAECRLSEARLYELADEGHVDAQKVVGVVSDLGSLEVALRAEAEAASTQFEDMLRESREQLRDSRLAEISSKVSSQV